ncbi:MAG TPA: hypothetical protein VJ992_15500 [Gemmatimonadales bacterium]|nr:hypothetical protein [Gemmatimonadales bacterium]
MFRTRWIGVAAAAAALGCGRTVLVPPRVDLAPLATLGIIDFTSSSEGVLAHYTTERFLEMIRRGQGTIPIVEIGTRDDALRAIGADSFDFDALKALGAKYHIRTLIVGQLTLSNVRPNLRVVPRVGYVGVSANVTGTLVTRMVDVETGASLWNASSTHSAPVGFVTIAGSHIAFNAREPDRAYGELVNPIVQDVTRDFRPTREHR